MREGRRRLPERSPLREGRNGRCCGTPERLLFRGTGGALFTNVHLALESLSPGMQAMFSRLRAVHCAAPSYDRASMDAATAASGGMKYTDHGPREEEARHPVAHTHPEIHSSRDPLQDVLRQPLVHAPVRGHE